MNWDDKMAEFTQIGTDLRRLLIRGFILLLIGASLAFASLLNPDATLMHAREFSWLPAAGWVVLAVGVLQCFDAAIAKEARDFYANLPTGILDIVVGGLVILSISGQPSRLSLMIAAFLIAKGLMRMVLAYATHAENKQWVIVSAWVSIILGSLIVAEWPSSAGWFLAFCLSIDIALRGWSGIVYALWLKAQKTAVSA